jgi:hypothetical protein
MRLGDRRLLLSIGALIAIGTALRLWIAFTNYGFKYDIDSAYITAALLVSHPLHAYQDVRYPYPAGFFPVILVCHYIAQGFAIAFYKVWKVPAILCDAGIAALLAFALDRLGAPPRERLIAVALVALGPSFILVSGYHGQIDSVAIMPALAGLIVWKLGLGGDRRAWYAGLLIGLGAAVKLPPLFTVMALLPSARSRREAAILVGCAVAIPVLSVVTFLLDNPGPTWHSLTYNDGVPGLGGLSVLIQPSLVRSWQHGVVFVPTSATVWFYEKQNWIVGLSALAAGGWAYWRRLEPVTAAALIWVTVYVANFDWAYQYFIWGFPFFLLAGWRRSVAILQLLLALPAAQIYFHWSLPTFSWAYVPLIMLVWALFAGWLVAIVRRPATPAWG